MNGSDGPAAPDPGRLQTRLVGRAAESERLHRFITGIADQGGALLLLGEAGVGKTALLDEAAAQAVTGGVRVLRATGAQFEAEMTYAALHQLLQPCFGELKQLSPLHAEALNVASASPTGRHPRNYWSQARFLRSSNGQPSSNRYCW